MDDPKQQHDLFNRRHHINIYFPIFTILEFLFYMGWLKVAERLMHPFGEEDDDFELNYIFDCHVYVGFMIVDDLHGHRPAFIKDPFWDKEPWVPHTKASGRIKDRRPRSHFGVNLPFSEMELKRQASDTETKNK